jgi:hypothetical protein
VLLQNPYLALLRLDSPLLSMQAMLMFMFSLKLGLLMAFHLLTKWRMTPHSYVIHVSHVDRLISRIKYLFQYITPNLKTCQVGLVWLKQI